MSTMPPKKNTKIMVFGTFDGVHNGHLDFFHQARHLAERPFLIISMARDINVVKIKKAKPYFNEKKRMSIVKKTGLADKVVLGGIKNHLLHIKKENPDIIALGYDQKAYVWGLKKELKRMGLTVKVVRLKPYKEKIYKNSLLHAKSVKILGKNVLRRKKSVI